MSDDQEALAADIAFSLLGLEDENCPVESIGVLSLEIAEKLRALAIIVLLEEGDVDLFYHNLIRAGLSRVKYLERLVAESAVGDFHAASGRYEPLLSAIAANAFDVTSTIVALSPDEFHEEAEYEDDYCYAQLIHSLASGAASIDNTQALFSQFEEYLNGEDSPRFEVCKALVEQDQESFDRAFESLLDARELEIAEAKERGQIESQINLANRHVFVEGLALLRLAERRLLRTLDEYRFCPGVARLPMVVPFTEEI